MDHFRPELFAFLRELERNNTREWFQAHRERYRADVQEPLLAFISAFASPLAKISRHFVADPRPVGGSMFRIHRDTRFARDKSPYKTHAAAQFRHREGRDVHAPGFYLHLGPGEVFMGAGLWHPDGPTLAGIRAAIVDDPAGWRRASRGLALGGESLKRPPRGVDPDHPLVEDLKRKDFVSFVESKESAACAPGFLASFTESCRSSAPLVRFLTRAVGLEF
ncbi:MAG: TIGR02453 family protein [Thermoanaerobaculales bacterium]|jgi:uncharacterized protein (TIGR02453 family)|nr:TIGR02453 family protein [Thermoanaerobaculales bacterium]